MYAAGNIVIVILILYFRSFKVMNAKLMLNKYLWKGDLITWNLWIFSGLFDLGIIQNNMKNFYYIKK